MNAWMNEFRELNLVLTLSCSPIYLSDKLVIQVLFYFHILINLTHIFVTLSNHICTMLMKEQTWANYSFRLRIVLHQVFGLLVMWRVCKKRHQIRNIVTSCTKHMSSEDFKKLRLFNRLILIPWILWQVTGLVNLFFDSPERKNMSLFSYFLYNYGKMRSWQFVTFGIFLSLTKAISLSELSCYYKLTCQAKTIDYRTINRCLTRISNLKDSVTKTLSFTLCFAFCYLFIKGISDVVWMKLTQETSILDNLLSKIRAMFGVISFLLIVVMAYVTSKQREDCHEALNALETSITNTHEMSSKWLSVLRTIDQSRNQEYRAWNCFAIDKSMLLIFISSFVTFTVLFVQLIY